MKLRYLHDGGFDRFTEGPAQLVLSLQSSSSLGSNGIEFVSILFFTRGGLFVIVHFQVLQIGLLVRWLARASIVR